MDANAANGYFVPSDPSRPMMSPNIGVMMVPTTAPLISPTNGMGPPANRSSQSPKNVTHRVISGSIRKSPTTSFAVRKPPTPVATYNAMTNTYETQPNLTGSRAASRPEVVFVHVHNPTNYNSVTTRPMHKNVLMRSPFFESRLKALVSGLDLPAVHIVTDPVHFNMVANWLQTNQIINQAGSVPNLHTLAMLIFLADELELWQLVGQLIQMMRTKQYAMDGSVLPSYFDIYKKTRTGNLFRIYAAESYIEESALGRSVTQALEDLPAGMLVDIIKVQNEKHAQFAAQWKKQSAERQEKALTEMKKHYDDCHQKILAGVTARYEEQFKRAEEGLKAHYMKTYGMAWEEMKKRNNDLQPEIAANTNVLDNRVDHNDVEVVKKMNRDTIAEIKRMNDERYNKLVQDAQKLNANHMEAVKGMRIVHEEREADLQEEIANLKKALTLKRAYENAEPTRSEEVDLNKTEEDAGELYRVRHEVDDLKKAAEESRAQITELRRINSEAKERHLKVVADLEIVTAGEAERYQTEMTEVKRMNEELTLLLTQSQSELVHLDKVLEESRVQLTSLQQAHSKLESQSQAEIAELRRINADSEERNRREVEHLIKVHKDTDARYQNELAAQQMMMEGNENRNRKRVMDLKKINEENKERQKREMTELKKWKDKNEEYRRKEVAELKRVNQDLLEDNAKLRGDGK